MCIFCENKAVPPTRNILVLDCPHIREIPVLPSHVHTLMCNGCINLREIHSSDFITMLEIHNSPMLRSIPYFSMLSELSLVMTGITTYPAFPRLTQLAISSQDVESIPHLQNLNILTLFQTGIVILPYLPRLKILSCASNTYLVSIASYPMLEELDCRGCENLKNIPPQPQLNSLNCCNTGVETISYYPVLYYLECDECTNLTSIHSSPNLSILSCCNCVNLHRIGKMPSLDILSCIGCRSLFSISHQTSLNNLNCSKCILLAKLPKLVNSSPYAPTVVCRGCPLLPYDPAYHKTKRGVKAVEKVYTRARWRKVYRILKIVLCHDVNTLIQKYLE